MIRHSITLLALTLLPGCFSPQQAVKLRLVDGETNAPLQQVAVTSYSKTWGTTMPGMIPVYRVNPTHYSQWPPKPTLTDEKLEKTIASNEYLLLNKPGYEELKISPTLLGIQIENMVTGVVTHEYLFEESTVVPLPRSDSWEIESKIAAGYLIGRRPKSVDDKGDRSKE